MRLAAPLGLLLVFSAASGLAAKGWSGEAPAAAGIALAVTLAAALAGHGLGRLRSRDPVAGWALSRGAAAWLIAILCLLPLLGSPAAIVATPGAVVGYFAARRSLHASDLAFLSVVAAIAVGFPFHRDAWEPLSAALVPMALVALALGLREAWDLGLLHDAARARQSPLPDGAPGAPRQRAAVARAALLAWAVVAAGVVLAVGVALLRDASGSWREGSAAALLILAVLGLGGAAWLQRRA